MQTHLEEKLVVGIAVIDKQHETLIEMIDLFYDALEKKKPRESQLKLLAEFLAYVKYHFNVEERLMERHRYPLVAEHISEHEDFRKKAGEWHKQAAAGRLIISVAIAGYFRNWFVRHISEKDKAACGYIIDKNLS